MNGKRVQRGGVSCYGNGTEKICVSSFTDSNAVAILVVAAAAALVLKRVFQFSTS
jgi:hypothetical protein